MLKILFKPYTLGGGRYSKSFILGGSAPRSNPLPFYIPFLTEKVPLSYSYIFYQIVPLLFTYLVKNIEALLNAVKALSLKSE